MGDDTLRDETGARRDGQGQRAETEAAPEIEALAASALLEQVHNAVIATDMNGVITSWNRFAEHLYGWAASDVIGRDILDVTVGAGSAAQAQEIMRSMAEQGSWEGEFEVLRKDGSRFVAHVIDAVVRDERGIPVGVVGVSYDVTPRIRAETERDALLQRLLEVRDEERTRLTALLGDEPVQVLTAAATRLTTARMRLEPGPNADAIADVEHMIEREIQHLRHALFDLEPHTLERHGLASAIEDVADRQAGSAGIVVTFASELTDAVDDVRALAVYRIAREAIGNVLRHASARSVSVELHARAGRLTLQVRDDGIGFDRDTPRAAGSTGIALMQLECARVGGTLTIETSPGAGTEVVARLPLG